MRVAIVLMCAVLAAPVRADRTDDTAIALGLFEDGRQLAAHGEFASACAKYEAARALESWLGVELNLADCYEHIGKTASAWALFRKAAAEADRLADPRATYARDRADRLEPRVSHLVIEGGEGVDVALDGKALPGMGMKTVLPVDPGEHELRATAPAHVAWSHHVIVAANASVELVVPALAVDVRAAATPHGHDAPGRRSHAAWWIGGAGIAAIGTSLIIGLDAKVRYDDAHGCDPQLVCNSTGYTAVRDARYRGNLATIVGAAGFATIAASVIVYLRTPVIPLVAPSALGISVQGSL
jgi:hypothetical protein